MNKPRFITNAQLGERLAERRRELGMTGRDVAFRLGRHRTWVVKAEKGHRPIQADVFIRWCAILGLDVIVQERD